MSETVHSPFPLKGYGRDIFDANGEQVCCVHSRRQIDFANRDAIIRFCNSHDALLKACKAFVEAREKSLQLEKTEVALYLAKKAIAEDNDGPPNTKRRPKRKR